MANGAAMYNLKAVTREVGLSPETLRAWERRYDLPKPVRTPGGHRLYSRQDIDMLKWLVERQHEGLSISRAIELWNQLKEDGLSTQPARPALVVNALPGEPVLDSLREQWIAACLSFDEAAANHVLDQAFSISAPEVICTEVLLKGLAQVGDRWYANLASVQQEHFTSAIAIRRVNTLLSATSDPTQFRRILVAGPPGEGHDFILLILTYLLKRQGWDVVYIGSNVPLEDLDATIQATAPELIISSAQTLPAAASLRNMSQYLLEKGIPLAYGGGIFNREPGVAEAIAGSFLGSDVLTALQAVEQLLAVTPARSALKAITSEYVRALKSYIHNEAFILNHIADSAQGIAPAHLEIAIANFTHLIRSALELGDINFLSQPIAWLNGLLGNRGIPVVMSGQILSMFNQAIEQYLGQDGMVISDWLKKKIESE